MLWLTSFFAGLLIAATPTNEWNDFQADAEFNFYLGEFLENHLDEFHPLQVLIEDRLVESFFSSTNEKLFRERLKKLNAAFENNPSALLKFEILNQALQEAFREKVAKAKRTRWIMTTSGAVIGALIAIPIGRWVGPTTLGPALALSIPVGALSGAGAGFLLSELLYMPRYRFDGLNVTADISLALEDLESEWRD
jgi:hypothetical protein